MVAGLRRRHACPALVLALAHASCLPANGSVGVAAAASSSNQERTAMQPKLSRIPAPPVQPIEIAGVRYEQVRNGLTAGLDQMGGYLAAVDPATGHQLWTLKVYDNRRDPALEGDVQDVFFRSMTLQADGKLLIENERRVRFVVDTAARTATAAP
jgi:hypothetical protein